MKKLLGISFLLLSTNFAFAQFFGQIPQQTKYNAAKVVDPDYGITMYEKLNFAIGGDSTRNDKKGYSCQGWIEDIYESGTILHKGFYEDGHLKLYKNFYENGNVEREFKIVDFHRTSMKLYYPDGKLKSDIIYYDGQGQIWTDYYPNGQLEYYEEYDKNMQFLIKRNSFEENGSPKDLFEMIDPKKKLYVKKEYENGKLKAEGTVKYNKQVGDYQKDGTWKIYESNGKVTEEKWVSGEQVVN